MNGSESDCEHWWVYGWHPPVFALFCGECGEGIGASDEWERRDDGTYNLVLRERKSGTGEIRERHSSVGIPDNRRVRKSESAPE